MMPQVLLQRIRLVLPGNSRVGRVVRLNTKIADMAAFDTPDGVNQVRNLR